MSEHTWFREHVEMRLAGGLPPEETERFQRHLNECEACRETFHEWAEFAESMENLFAGIGPAPGLEDRVIQRLRTGAARAAGVPPAPRWALAAAAALLLGILGFLLHKSPLAMERRIGEQADVGFWGEMQAPADRIAEPSGPSPRWQTDLHELASRGDNQGLAPEVFAERKAAELLAQFQDGKVTQARSREPGTGARTPAEGDSMPSPSPKKEDGIRLDARAGARAGIMPSPSPKKEDGILVGERKPLTEEGGGAGVKEARAPNAAGDPYFSFRDETLDNREGKDKSSAGPKSYFRPNDPASWIPPQIVTGGRSESKDPLKANYSPVQDRAAGAMPPSGPETTKLPPAPASSTSSQAPPLEIAPQEPPPVQRKVIRSGQIEFEIEGFDSSLLQIYKIVGEEGGFVSTVNSEKLPNGKVKGTITVRVPPDRLDTLVLKLRALGDLKSQRIGAQDVTKHYTDLESRLRAARAMEERLMRILKEGKGEVKDLLEVEKQIGTWREKIEELEGEIKYYNNLISLSTLTIVLFERDIKTPSAASERERVEMGVEGEDVEKAYRSAEAAIAECKGRIILAELRMLEAGQMAASIECEVDPDKSGPLIDRFKQLGHLARMQVDRQQVVEGGVGRIEGIQVKRLDTWIKVSIYNLTNVAPRRSVRANVACPDVEGIYKTLIERVHKTRGRVVNSSLNRQRQDQTTGYIRFEVPAADAEAMRDAIRLAGEVITLTVTENPDARNVTDSKHGFEVTLHSLGAVAPRDTVSLQLAARDVADAYRTLQAKVREWGGRILSAQINETDRSNITAFLDFDVPRDREAELGAQMGAIGDILNRSGQRATQAENTIESKVRYQIRVINLAQIDPRESAVLAIEVSDVEETIRRLRLLVEDKKGRVASSNVARQRSGRVVGRMMCDIPLGEFLGAVDAIKREGTLRVAELSKNPQVPDSALAIARLDVTVANADLIVGSDEGIGAFLGKGLRWMLLSLSYLATGLVVVVPWALIAFGAHRLLQHIRRRRQAAPAKSA